MRKTTTSGSSARLLAVLTLIGCVAAVPALGRKKPVKTEAFATIAGTVFRQPGFAVAGVEVVVEPESSSKDGVKFKKEKLLTNSRGEWALRVPAVPMKYVVRVLLNGYDPQDRTVSIQGEQREELNFLLEPRKESKQ